MPYDQTAHVRFVGSTHAAAERARNLARTITEAYALTIGIPLEMLEDQSHITRGDN